MYSDSHFPAWSKPIWCSQEPPGIGSARRFVAAAAEVGTCPLHSHDRYRALYDKLVETARAQAAPDEESDMEASDVEDETPNVNSDSIPLGTTFRTIHLIQQPVHEPPADPPPGILFLPRKLSTISSQDRESIPNIEDEEAEAVQEENATIEAEVHAKHDPLKTTDFEWHPDDDPEEEEEEEHPEARALLLKESRYRNTDL